MMNTNEIEMLVDEQRDFFRSGETRSTDFRIQQLHHLKTSLKNNEERLFEAVQTDFSKPEFETYGTELGILYEEIDLHIKNIPTWSKRKKVPGSWINFPSQNYIYPEPYGVALVIGAWNYPILLAVRPVVSAIAAGNTVVLKPSEIAPHTAGVLNQIISNNFSQQFLSVVEGAADTAGKLLDQPFDYIFFTGSTRVGKLVMKAAAEHLTPITLELGGKSPAIVDQTADLATAAKRIAWGKFLNAGQTCVAPDYLLAEHSIKDQLLEELRKAITEFYGDHPRESPDYARIINDDHFERLRNFLGDSHISIGGETDAERRYIAPTVLDDIQWDDAVMQEEIFGPILPVIGFDDYEGILRNINKRPTPLSLFLFSSDSEVQDRVIRRTGFGGGCINDTISHLGNPSLPFGGKGHSGMGNYHGKAGFDTFTHYKSIMKKPTWLDIPFRYAPYSNKLKWLKKILN